VTGLEVFLNQVILKRIGSKIKIDRRKSKTNFYDSAFTSWRIIGFTANISR
jgi:hypothetical protein